MHFGFHAPSPALVPLAAGIWFASSKGSASAPAAEPIVPDGFMELVFNLADPFVRLPPDGDTQQPLDLLVGQLTEPTTARSTGRVDLVGVRLRPDRAACVLGMPAWLLRNQLISAEQVFGSRLTELIEALADSADPGV